MLVTVSFDVEGQTLDEIKAASRQAVADFAGADTPARYEYWVESIEDTDGRITGWSASVRVVVG